MGHAVRASMGTVWETCMYVWPSCVTGTPSGITSHLPPYDHTLSPLKHNSIHDPPPPTVLPSCTHPPVNAPCIDAVSTAIDRSYVSGHWHYSCMTSTLQAIPLLVLYMSSNIDLNSISCSHERNGKEYTKEGRAVKHPKWGGKKKDGEEFDGFLILVRNQTSSESAQLLQLKAPLAVRNLAVTCTLKTRPPLDFGWITDEVFCYSDGSF